MGAAVSRRPLVSVIIACYNRAHIVPRAIQSALAQDYSPIEVIVADDGSSDDSVVVAGQHGAKVIAHEHIGPPGIRNVGVDASSGEYIAFLDADDVWTEGSLSRRMEVFEKADAGMVFADAGVAVGGCETGETYLAGRTEIDEMDTAELGNGDYLIECDPIPYLLRRSFVLTSTAIVNRKAWNRAGGFDPELLFAEDFDLWLRIADHHQLAYSTTVSALYEQHDDSMTRKRRFVAYGLVKVWTKQFEQYRGRYPKLGPLIAGTLGSHAYDAGLIAAEEGDKPLARRYFGTALRCDPGFKSAWVAYAKTLI